MLDKDGRKLTYAGNNTNELAVSGYDISEITVYLYDYDEYMEIKGLALGENSTAFREILEKNALYEKKISIENRQVVVYLLCQPDMARLRVSRRLAVQFSLVGV